MGKEDSNDLHVQSQSQSSVLVVAGAVSGIAEALVVQPFDMVKTRFQLNSGANPPVFSYMRQMIREEGFFRFYRGLGAEMLGMIPKSSAMYASYEIFRRMVDEAVKGSSIGSQWTASTQSSVTCFIAGGLSGIPEAAIVTPFQVIKVRLQAKDFIGKYSNTADCAIKIVREEGILKMLSGLSPTILRNSVWNAVYFGSMDFMKQTVSSIFPSNRSFVLDRAQTLVTGFLGAVFATCFNAPFDVVKSRIQSQPQIAAIKSLKYQSTFQTMGLILREEGWQACYKGFQPKAIRMGLGGGVAMVVFELICYGFNETSSA